MRKEDKLKNMVNANKRFQERINDESIYAEEKEIIYTIVPDMHPKLSKMLK